MNNKEEGDIMHYLKIIEPRCRCYINASYNFKTAWRTGKLPKPCPIRGHDEDLKPHDKIRPVEFNIEMYKVLADWREGR